MEPLIPADTARSDWLNDLVRRWQVAAGLRLVTRQTDLGRTLAEVLPPIASPRTTTERLLLRGYCLEVELALRRIVTRCRSADGRMRLQRLADRLETPCPDLSGIERELEAAIGWLRDTSIRSHPGLAHRVRVVLDEWNGERLSLARLARRFGTNPRYVTLSFMQEFGISPAQYLRRRRTAETILALRGEAASVKELADRLGCAEATVRRLVRAATGISPRHVRHARFAARASAAQVRRFDELILPGGGRVSPWKLDRPVPERSK